jgi:hypothetical protein
LSSTRLETTRLKVVSILSSWVFSSFMIVY